MVFNGLKSSSLRLQVFTHTTPRTDILIYKGFLLVSTSMIQGKSPLDNSLTRLSSICAAHYPLSCSTTKKKVNNRTSPIVLTGPVGSGRSDGCFGSGLILEPFFLWLIRYVPHSMESVNRGLPSTDHARSGVLISGVALIKPKENSKSYTNFTHIRTGQFPSHLPCHKLIQPPQQGLCWGCCSFTPVNHQVLKLTRCISYCQAAVYELDPIWHSPLWIPSTGFSRAKEMIKCLQQPPS